jgi:sugar (pentulose or hexulose) kinase
MAKLPVIAIFDVGKTNKKLFLFDEQYRIVYEKTARFLETKDEDGDACENLDSIRLSVFESLNEILKSEEYELVAINFSTYGASMVYLDQDGRPIAPLYNYLKAYPKDLAEKFYSTYGGKMKIAMETSSPASGNLNAGMQLYRMKYRQPAVFKKIRYAVHLPQYVSYLISGQIYSEMTSIGCHTQLWNFEGNKYHDWVFQEGLEGLLPPIFPSDQGMDANFMGRQYLVGAGLHDSSAALIPYQASFREPFILLSTGTWCISMNPFNSTPLNSEELENDCLAYIGYQGKPVKASRLFAGNEHEQQVKRIAAAFGLDPFVFRTIEFDPNVVTRLKRDKIKRLESVKSVDGKSSVFSERSLELYENYVAAYHQLIMDLVDLQHYSTSLIINGTAIKKIFVDGGFSKNAVYMNLLASAFPDIEVYAAAMAQATALGTAIAIHKHWNRRPLANDLIALKYYSVNNQLCL